jgi:hypothetical protein
MLIRDFPYGIFYEVQPKRIVVSAIIDLRQELREAAHTDEDAAKAEERAAALTKQAEEIKMALARRMSE